jgi:threonine dehydrogenase-like Zn-dependent dehydrogenase
MIFGRKPTLKAIALVPGTTNLRLADRPVPAISAPDEIKLRVLQVGICGTDREEAAGGRADPPAGQAELVIGHEMFGQVVEVGPAVKAVQPGNFALFTVRRGCGHCPACLAQHSDMCYSGDYTERGIKGRDGYQAEYVVDSEPYIVKVPDNLVPVGVLGEPMSVSEKAIDEAARIQLARLPDATDAASWLRGKRALIAGLGPIGLLAAFILRLRDAEVLGLDIVDEATVRPGVLKAIGGTYVDGRQVNPDAIDDHFGEIDLIFEATGVASLEFDLLAALGDNGVYVLTGIPGGDRPISLDGAALMRQLVLRNQVMIGSVNANRVHFQMAVDDLAKARETWGSTVDRVITHRFPYTQFREALTHHTADEIKSVIEWASI